MYQSRSKDESKYEPETEDPMYDEVDRFHQNQDFIQFDQNDDDDDSSEDDMEEAVLNLRGDDDDEGNEDEEDIDSDESSEKEQQQSHDDSEDEDEEILPSPSSDEEDDEEELEDVRDWGRKKSAYYHGDTADLEIGQEEEDAFVEEQAAKEVQAARYKQMSEDDFIISDAEDDDDNSNKYKNDRDVAVSAKISKLSTKERKKLLEKQHPELLPLLSHFSDILQDLKSKTWVATHAVFDGEAGTAEVSLDKHGNGRKQCECTHDRLEHKRLFVWSF